MSTTKRKREPRVAAFASVHYEVLEKLRKEMTALKQELTDDYDKRDLSNFVPIVISNFTTFGSEIHAMIRLAKSFGLAEDDRLVQVRGLDEQLELKGCQLLFLLAVIGSRACERDFSSGIRLIKGVLSGISKIQARCRDVGSQKGTHG